MGHRPKVYRGKTKLTIVEECCSEDKIREQVGNVPWYMTQRFLLTEIAKRKKRAH